MLRLGDRWLDDPDNVKRLRADEARWREWHERMTASFAQDLKKAGRYFPASPTE